MADKIIYNSKNEIDFINRNYNYCKRYTKPFRFWIEDAAYINALGFEIGNITCWYQIKSNSCAGRIYGNGGIFYRLRHKRINWFLKKKRYYL